MDFDELLLRSTVPNADVDCFPAGDAIAEANLAVTVDTEKAIRNLDPSGSLGPVGAGVPPYIGHAMNAPNPGSPALIRVAGFCRVIYGATVAAYDLLRLDTATGKVVPFDVSSGDGHVHEFVVVPIRHVVTLTDIFNAPVTGAAADLSATLQWDNTGAFTAASETVTISEIGAGEYLVEFTPDAAGTMYRLLIMDASSRVVTPAEFQTLSVARMQGPSSPTLSMIIGQALVAGVADDVGLMLLRPQVF